MNKIDQSIDKLPACPPYVKAKECGLVEAGIIPLCDALVKLGASPVSSCEGHVLLGLKSGSKVINFFVSLFSEERRNWYKPFVVFTASLETAAAIHHAIQAIPQSTEFGYLPRKSYFVWDVEGNFMGGSKLAWKITTNDYRLSSGSNWVEGDINQSVTLLQNDIILIAQILEELANQS